MHCANNDGWSHLFSNINFSYLSFQSSMLISFFSSAIYIEYQNDDENITWQLLVWYTLPCSSSLWSILVYSWACTLLPQVCMWRRWMKWCHNTRDVERSASTLSNGASIQKYSHRLVLLVFSLLYPILFYLLHLLFLVLYSGLLFVTSLLYLTERCHLLSPLLSLASLSFCFLCLI